MPDALRPRRAAVCSAILDNASSASLSSSIWDAVASAVATVIRLVVVVVVVVVVESYALVNINISIYRRFVLILI